MWSVSKRRTELSVPTTYTPHIHNTVIAWRLQWNGSSWLPAAFEKFGLGKIQKTRKYSKLSNRTNDDFERLYNAIFRGMASQMIILIICKAGLCDHMFRIRVVLMGYHCMTFDRKFWSSLALKTLKTIRTNVRITRLVHLLLLVPFANMSAATPWNPFRDGILLIYNGHTDAGDC